MDRQAIIARTQRILDCIATREPDEATRDWIIRETVAGFRDHVNPGFLEYRKSVSTDYTAVEWTDGGTVFRDLQGREFIDCLGGYGIYSLGHRHPKVVKAVRDQLARQALHSQELLDPLRALLADVVADITPGDLQYTFFTNSGTEAVEGALKLARLYTGRKAFVAAARAFHGKSMGSLSATGKAAWRQPFLPLVPGFVHVPFGDAGVIEKVLAAAEAVGDPVAAVLLEPIQGEGGVHVPPDDYLPRVREACDRHGALLILDEVQTGLGRTGALWACDHWGVAPDILTLGKAFGGGVMPIGAFVGTAEIWQPMIPNPMLHTSTFGGNPLACAAALAAVNVVLEEALPERAAELGAFFLHEARTLVARYPRVAVEARGKGLLIGLEFVSDAAGYAVARGLFQRGVLVAGATFNAKVIRVEPPLTITREELEHVLEVLAETLAEVNAA